MSVGNDGLSRKRYFFVSHIDCPIVLSKRRFRQNSTIPADRKSEASTIYPKSGIFFSVQKDAQWFFLINT